MNILKFKGLSSVFGVAILLTVAILMFMSMIATVDASSVANVKVVEDNGKIGVQKTTVAEPKGDVSKKFKKVKTYTLTFNANGGKVGTKTKKLSYKKSYGTLPKPTRSGYTFEGWFTAKKGGKKVSKTTKMPAKNTVVYAQWKKQRTLNANEKALVGKYYYGFSSPGFWTYTGSGYGYELEKFTKGVSTAKAYTFNADGTYEYYYYGDGSLVHGYGTIKGNWAVTTKGKVRMTNNIGSYTNLRSPSESWKNNPSSDSTYSYAIEKVGGVMGLRIGDTPDSYSYMDQFLKKT